MWHAYSSIQTSLSLAATSLDVLALWHNRLDKGLNFALEVVFGIQSIHQLCREGIVPGPRTQNRPHDGRPVDVLSAHVGIRHKSVPDGISIRLALWGVLGHHVNETRKRGSQVAGGHCSSLVDPRIGRPANGLLGKIRERFGESGSAAPQGAHHHLTPLARNLLQFFGFAGDTCAVSRLFGNLGIHRQGHDGGEHQPVHGIDVVAVIVGTVLRGKLIEN
mmetsp:Transcript_13506/g.27930  ORF Transcript_13506/g.27930 Transcript_13506/m.27930 type:complete len:219 (-) Transcript_13506:743-1399(-)